ncbi:cytochrome c oxidase assembly factor 7 [Corythoichthys intestinalis]|uniref:cytochrome c oxidase assembly factor 7 n=1 Tax=Corythoichthys intestinalis TaxID=161448 RepID=UPI0025A5D926|nr:cytochrome c oxidase assembly factor 7 [Corythoichthys intestinalis]XP_061790187.1 cytochrome c oxidase assembly factor 7-like [Nerophis lumbriciformis]
MAGLINFEDEEEVKQFLDNLGVEYSFQCYNEKNPEGCQRLADYMEGVKQNFEAAAQVLKHNCETYNHPGSCYKLGSYHVVGRGGVSKCLKSAYSCFKRACDAGGKKSMDACHSVGLVAHDGRAMEGGTPNPEVARRYYETACAGGFAPSCFNLSALYIEGNAKGVKPDMAMAFKYAERACELGHLWGCANASRMYKLGDGIEKDEKKAEELKNRARELHGMQKEKQLKFGE